MQLIAMLSMLADHIGIAFAPGEAAWRAVGRLAFPLYLYGIVLGYRRTRSLKRYFGRLLLLGVLSQAPFMLALHDDGINAVGTMLLCLAVIAGLDRCRGPVAIVAMAAIVAAACVLAELLRFDYGAYAVLLAVIFRYTRGTTLVLLHFALTGFYLLRGSPLELFSVIATIVLIYFPGVYRTIEQRVPIPRVVWRAFYPAHLAILAMVAFYVNY